MREAKVALLATMIWLGSAVALHGQNGEPVEIARAYTVSSTILGEDRPVQVALPLEYDTAQAYPVVYVLDGPGHLVHTTGTVRFLAANGRMPAAIVVAIANTPGNRTRDLTPPPGEDDDSFDTAGGASRFQAFLRDELKPWVESRYSTRPYDVLVGHSFGGLFIAHVLNTEPSLFDAYVAISPSLWWADESFVAGLDDVFERFPDTHGALYMTMGNEGGAMISGAWHLAGTLEKSAPSSFRWHWKPMPTETHGSVPARSTYDGLEWIFSGWYPIQLMDDLAQRGASELPRLETHFTELSAEFGWEVAPPVTDLVNTVHQMIERGRTDDAMVIAARTVEWFPASAYARFGLGQAHMGACRWNEAEEHHTRALEMAEAEDPNGGLADFIRGELSELRKKAAAADRCEPGA
jgi:predicted alpha/beta superfamily hydrolase